jgi:Uma2 family endonuclease
MPVQLQRRLLTVAEYHTMIDAGILTESDRLELLNGEIIYMSPIGSPHAAMVRRLDEILHQLLKGKALVSTQNPVAIADFSEPEPDIALLKRRADYYVDGHPQPQDIFLVIEVADSSLGTDREVKLPIYATAGIPVYWIVNLTDQQIEVYHTPDEGIYKVREIATPKDHVSLDSLGLELAVKEVLG